VLRRWTAGRLSPQSQVQNQKVKIPTSPNGGEKYLVGVLGNSTAQSQIVQYPVN
jgi:hypothetical protein